MKDSLLALSFLLSLVVLPFFVSVGIAWSVLHVTDTGLLVGGGEVMVVADAAGDDKKVVECSYFTSDGFEDHFVDHDQYGYRGQRNCPWYIDASV